MVLYSLSNILSVRQYASKASKKYRVRIKEIMKLPQGFPSAMLHLPAREGGLAVPDLEEVAYTDQLKAMARMLRLAHPFVDAVYSEGLVEHHSKLYEQLGVPHGITAANSLNSAVVQAKADRTERVLGQYKTSGLFAHRRDTLGNGWLRTGAKYLSDGDRIRGLRLRSNLYPTRVLSNKHSQDPTACLCHRCGKEEETAKHILQICPSVAQVYTCQG
ncbi:uncharacterized protein LOC135375548 [Ornithodoros turicata]|uniref:uncharacterized protein LOC135375548 n=1 Tax=Ornithodoros turicata TaxID=34597 RepID=UPI0031390364